MPGPTPIHSFVEPECLELAAHVLQPIDEGAHLTLHERAERVKWLAIAIQAAIEVWMHENPLKAVQP